MSPAYPNSFTVSCYCVQIVYKWAFSSKKAPHHVCEQRRPGSACAYAQSDLGLRCSPKRRQHFQYHMIYYRNTKSRGCYVDLDPIGIYLYVLRWDMLVFSFCIFIRCFPQPLQFLGFLSCNSPFSASTFLWEVSQNDPQ